MPDISAKRPLRSVQWFGPADKNGFMYRSGMKSQGIADPEPDVTADSVRALKKGVEGLSGHG